MYEKNITLYIKTEQPKSGQKWKNKCKKKKRLEFMQKVVLIALTLPYVWVTLSYILAFMEKTNPLEDLSGCVVSVPIFAIVGYITQNSVRSASFNKMKAELGIEDNMLKEREQRGMERN